MALGSKKKSAKKDAKSVAQEILDLVVANYSGRERTLLLVKQRCEEILDQRASALPPPEPSTTEGGAVEGAEA